MAGPYQDRGASGKGAFRGFPAAAFALSLKLLGSADTCSPQLTPGGGPLEKTRVQRPCFLFALPPPTPTPVK